MLYVLVLLSGYFGQSTYINRTHVEKNSFFFYDNFHWPQASHSELTDHLYKPNIKKIPWCKLTLFLTFLFVLLFGDHPLLDRKIRHINATSIDGNSKGLGTRGRYTADGCIVELIAPIYSFFFFYNSRRSTPNIMSRLFLLVCL